MILLRILIFILLIFSANWLNQIKNSLSIVTKWIILKQIKNPSQCFSLSISHWNVWISRNGQFDWFLFFFFVAENKTFFSKYEQIPIIFIGFGIRIIAASQLQHWQIFGVPEALISCGMRSRLSFHSILHFLFWMQILTLLCWVSIIPNIWINLSRIVSYYFLF